ncbi:DUF6565 domain-containing protein [Aquimarina agarivorans]|uniref:DUF6565 domain-containing protein n=1 Tax=Aquimarina agarivorans TaxID=980584 RepID=UPI000248F266|nr:DUF6565 domain-containing protein [Aquimarina agarivorans]
MSQNQVVRLLNELYVCHLNINQELSFFIQKNEADLDRKVQRFKINLTTLLKQFDVEFTKYCGSKIHTFVDELTLNNKSSIANLTLIKFNISKFNLLIESVLNNIICAFEFKNVLKKLKECYNTYYKFVTKQALSVYKDTAF